MSGVGAAWLSVPDDFNFGVRLPPRGHFSIDTKVVDGHPKCEADVESFMDAHQNRREYKFVLKPGQLAAVRASVSEHLAADRGAADGYPVVSEYFDTDGRNSYWQKQFGVPNRRRVRGRVYGKADGSIPPTAFIEVKHKADETIVKRRVAVNLADLAKFSKGQMPDAVVSNKKWGRRVMSEVNNLLDSGASRPVVQIRYHRYAFDSGPEGRIRITFDADLRCRFRLCALTPDDPDFELPLLEPGAAIMEVKTIGPVPVWLRAVIGKHSLVPRGFSKYAVALEKYEFAIPAPKKHSHKPC